MSGLLSYAQGFAGEQRVEAHYAARGARLIARRWRGSTGEVDLIFRDAGGYAFVEVKTSRTVESALQSLRPAQVSRILATGAEFLDTTPKGQLTSARFDLAAVDTTGRVEVVENALSA